MKMENQLRCVEPASDKDQQDELLVYLNAKNNAGKWTKTDQNFALGEGADWCGNGGSREGAELGMALSLVVHKNGVRL